MIKNREGGGVNGEQQPQLGSLYSRRNFVLLALATAGVVLPGCRKRANQEQAPAAATPEPKREQVERSEMIAKHTTLIYTELNNFFRNGYISHIVNFNTQLGDGTISYNIGLQYFVFDKFADEQTRSVTDTIEIVVDPNLPELQQQIQRQIKDDASLQDIKARATRPPRSQTQNDGPKFLDQVEVQ